MNVSLPDELKSYIDEQVGSGTYGSTSEYVRDLIRRDRERQHLRRALLDGATSAPGFYVVGDDAVDVWRILHSRRDMLSALPDESD
jgi:antitoxin ParD1/3/4